MLSILMACNSCCRSNELACWSVSRAKAPEDLSIPHRKALEGNGAALLHTLTPWDCLAEV